jgi:hypothetical protein
MWRRRLPHPWPIGVGIIHKNFFEALIDPSDVDDGAARGRRPVLFHNRGGEC